MDFSIGSFLKKFDKLTPPDDFLKKTLISIIKKEIGVSVKKSNIRVDGHIVYFSAAPTVKNEIFMKKPLILRRLNDALQKNIITDIL